MDRHAPLRTRFEWRSGRVVQVVEPGARFELETVQCPDLPVEAGDLGSYLKRISSRSMTVTEAPLLRGYLLERSRTDHVVFFTAHHLVFDGVSGLIFYRELIKRYGCAEPDDPSTLTPLEGTYRDYVSWQETMASGPVGVAYQEYLQSVLPGFVDSIPTVCRSHHRRVVKWSGTVPANVVQELQRFARSAGVTAFNVLLAMYQAALHLSLASNRMLVWVAVAGQHRDRFRRTIGCLMNEVPAFSTCRDRDDVGAFFAESLEHWSQVGQQFRGCPVEPCFEALDGAAVQAQTIDRALSATFLYQSFLRWLMPTDVADPRGNTLRWTWMENVHEPLDSDISMTAYPDRQGSIQLRLQWATDAIGADVAERIAMLYPKLLHAAATDPGCRMGAFRDRSARRRALPIRLPPKIGPAPGDRIARYHPPPSTRAHATGAHAL